LKKGKTTRFRTNAPPPTPNITFGQNSTDFVLNNNEVSFGIQSSGFSGLYLVHRALQAPTNGMIEHILGWFILCSSPIGVKVMPGVVHLLAVI
jgi:hypothetical protein